MDCDKTPSPADFIAIVGEATLEDAEKYLKMGKNSLEMALNYYYNKKDKTIKPSQSSQSQQPLTLMQKLQEGNKKQAHMEKIVKDLTSGFGRSNSKVQASDNNGKKKSPTKKETVSHSQASSTAPKKTSTSASSSIFSQKGFSDLQPKQKPATAETKEVNTPMKGASAEKKIGADSIAKMNTLFESWSKVDNKITPSTEAPRDLVDEEEKLESFPAGPLENIRESFGMHHLMGENLKSEGPKSSVHVEQHSVFMSELQESRDELILGEIMEQEVEKKERSNFVPSTKKNFKRNFAQFESRNNEILSLNELSKEAMQLEEDPIKAHHWPKLLGAVEVKAHVVCSLKIDAKQGDTLQLRLEKQAAGPEKKKGPRSKPVVNNVPVIIRVLYQEQEIGKLDQGFSQTVEQLLEREYISFDVTLSEAPSSWSTFATFYLNVKVNLLQSAASKPIMAIYSSEENLCAEDEAMLNDLKHTQAAFSALFEMLNLECTIPCLIKKSPNGPSMTQSQSQKPDKKGGRLSKQNTQQSQMDISGDLDKLEVENINNEEDIFRQLGFNESEYEEMESAAALPNPELPLSLKERKIVGWMLLREGYNVLERELLYKKARVLHPLWQEYRVPDGSFFYFNPFTGQLSVEVPKSTHDCCGGILVNMSGPLKAEVIAGIVQHNRYDTSVPCFDKLTVKKKYLTSLHGKNSLSNIMKGPLLPAGTLLIVSVGSLYTWEAELSRISQNDERFKVLVYYGQKRGNEKKDLGSYDLVLTTYGILSGEFASDGNKDLYNFEWHRVVLDEAQYIKGKRIQTTKAIEDLNMQNRWCLTNYSANNRSEDMFNMVNFLKLEPWSCPTWWTAYIGKPLDKGDEDAYEILYTILKPVTLVLGDNCVVIEGNSQRNRMPGVEKEERIEWVELSQEEKEFYICLLKKSKAEYDTLIAQDTLTEYYSHAFDLMMKVRQSCDHLFLIYSKFEVKDSDCLEKEITDFLGLQDDDEDSREAHDELSIEDEKYKRTKMHDHFEIIIDENTRTEQVFAIQKPHVMVNNQLIHETVERLNMGDIVHCPLCLNDLENVTVTVCGHILCSFCMRKSIEAKSMCPACNTILTRKDCLHISRNIVFSFNFKDKYKRSSKLDALMGEVQKSMARGEKCLVFSHFPAMMTLIELDMIQSGTSYIEIEATMSAEERDNRIKAYNSSPDIPVLLSSIVSKNIRTETMMVNTIFIVEPSNEEEVEEGILRNVHPISEGNKVEVVRFLCKGTVEEGIMELNQKKKQNNIPNTVDNHEERIRNNLEDLCYLIKTYENC